jgi:branched-subunit amino acid transport protein
MTTVTVVALVGAGSFALRFAPLVIGGRFLQSVRFEQLAGFAIVGALAALIVTAVSNQPADTPASGPVAPVAAMAAGAVVARRGGALHTVVIVGVTAHWAVVAATTALGAL